MQKTRPKHLDLINIKLPLPGIVSIMHRVSGAALFFLIPFLLGALQSTLGSPEAYSSLTASLQHPLAKLFMIAVAWGFFHHFCAGIRYLALDLHKGVQLPQARATSKAVLVVSILGTLWFGVWVW